MHPTDEVARFAQDVRTGRVIRCADGITRVVYSLEEARNLIESTFKHGKVAKGQDTHIKRDAPTAVRATEMRKFES